MSDPLDETPVDPPRPLKIDMEWTVDVLLHLLRTPSPAGRTDAVMQLVGDILGEVGLPFTLTRRGSLLADLPGRSPGIDRALVVHADTIGCMVRGLKDNGRLEVVQVGTFSARFAEGARVTIFAEDPDRTYSGTIMPLKASGHAYGDEVDTQGVGWEHVEVRVDEVVHDRQGLVELGIEVGNFVALDAEPVVTPSGFLVSRHLDGKAGVAAALGAVRAISESGLELPHRASLLVTIAEEIGQGASHGLDADVAEMVSVDNSVVAPGQCSREDGVTIPLADMTGPFDYHLTRRLLRLCRDHDLPHARDMYKWYRSDVAAALEAGAGTRAALVSFGLDGSHGWERTHLRSVEATAQLLSVWLQTPLTFARWDASPTGSLEDFPSSRQPAPEEQWGRLPEDGEPT